MKKQYIIPFVSETCVMESSIICASAGVDQTPTGMPGNPAEAEAPIRQIGSIRRISTLGVVPKM